MGFFFLHKIKKILMTTPQKEAFIKPLPLEKNSSNNHKNLRL